MSAAEMAIEESGVEGAPSGGSAEEVGSVPSSSPDTTQPEGASSRPEYLLEGYDNDQAQAQAHHKFVQQYGGQHDFYAQQGHWVSDRYYNDPAFREWFDNYRAGKQQQAAAPAQQEPPPYDKSNPDALKNTWDQWIDDPDRMFKIAEDRAYARIQKEFGPQLAQVKQQQNAERAQRLFAAHKTTLQEMQGNPYGQKLLALTNRGMDPEEAIATYLAAKSHFSAADPGVPGGTNPTVAPQAQPAVRDTQGRFQRVAGNGRRAGTTQTGKALTPDEIIAEAKAGRLR